MSFTVFLSDGSTAPGDWPQAEHVAVDVARRYAERGAYVVRDCPGAELRAVRSEDGRSSVLRLVAAPGVN
jgi:hypothetical protein